MLKNIIFILLLLATTFTFAFANEVINFSGSEIMFSEIMKSTTTEKVCLFNNNTDDAITALITGKCDLAGGTRPLTKKEKEKGLVEIKAFVDGYVFIINRSNPKRSIGLKKLKNILKGKENYWTANGNSNDRIEVITPPLSSSAFQFIKKKLKIHHFRKDIMSPSDIAVIHNILKYKIGGISWLSYSKVKDNKDFKILNISKKRK
ncbi:substrate-binding domain-containing protein, partial [Candidatus Margulisiibacteriota bacterium]